MSEKLEERGIVIQAITPGSPAEDAGLRVGDRLLRIDGHEIEDMLDVLFHLEPDGAEFEVERNGATEVIELVTSPGEKPGMELGAMDMRACHCKCTFCFIDQLPKGLRSPLYLKDEDYRFSFLFGNYLTLVGMNSHDYQRIFDMRLSPLYVSIHVTDPVIRGRLLGIKNAPILPNLNRLIEGGIQLHGQIVLVPGENDGAVLEQTIRDLAPLYPGLASLSVVPVGLTEHRQDLPSLRLMNKTEAQETLDTVKDFQQEMLEKNGTRWIYPADELLLQAGIEMPPDEYYEEYPQIENGVGLLRWTIHQAEEAMSMLPDQLESERRILWVTGGSAYAALQSIASKFCQRVRGLYIDVISVENHLLGQSVTAAGLLGGLDVYAAVDGWLKDRAGQKPAALYLPPDCLNSDGMFLDDWMIKDIAAKTGVPSFQFDHDWKAMITGRAAA